MYAVDLKPFPRFRNIAHGLRRTDLIAEVGAVNMIVRVSQKVWVESGIKYRGWDGGYEVTIPVNATLYFEDEQAAVIFKLTWG